VDALDTLRASLDAVDRRILGAIAERLQLVGQVSLAKQATSSHPRDAKREEALLKRLEGVAKELGVHAGLVRSVYRLLLDHSVRMQVEHQVDADNPGRRNHQLRVGYQGTTGCYSSIACAEYMAPRGLAPVYSGFEGFAPMLEAVHSGVLDMALLPIENTTAGTITESYDLLAKHDLALTGEHFLLVRHCLIALRPVPLANIRRVRSHPMALAQCNVFLNSLSDCLVERYPDTAMACDALIHEQDLSEAAIASEAAATERGLAILAHDIGDRADNTTRFVAVCRKPIVCDPRLPRKTSVILTLRHEQGALHGCLDALMRRGLNLTKLESRPSQQAAWLYNFYLDFTGSEGVDEAIEVLRALSPQLKVLGTYPMGERPTDRPT
jgi:chorismate mutase/prephenate dehydratase